MTDTPDWVTITDDEEIVWQGKPSPMPYIASLTGEIILVGVGFLVWTAGGITLFGLSLDPGVTVLSLSFWTLVGLVLIAWGGLGIIRTGLTWWSKHYVVTTDEVYKKTGIVARSVKNTRLSEIQNTKFSQSILGRLGSYGTVDIYTAGTAGREIGLEHVSDPDTVATLITEKRSSEGV